MNINLLKLAEEKENIFQNYFTNKIMKSVPCTKHYKALQLYSAQSIVQYFVIPPFGAFTAEGIWIKPLTPLVF